MKKEQGGLVTSAFKHGEAYNISLHKTMSNIEYTISIQVITDMDPKTTCLYTFFPLNGKETTKFTYKSGTTMGHVPNTCYLLWNISGY